MTNYPEGTKIGQYKLLKRLGVGAFGEIYSVQSANSKELLAMKIENIFDNTKSLLEKESNILQDLKDSRYTPELFDTFVTPKLSYLVMDCLGPSLMKVQSIYGDLTTKTVLRVGVHMLLAIKDVHMHGYLHRDIKPSNFLVVQNRRTVVKLIDFGLSRKYIDENGDFIRSNNGFVGSLKYASVHALLREEITQRDDLISWFYSLVDMIRGKLPWSRITNEKHNLRIKQSISAAKLCEKCPKQFIEIYQYLKGVEEFETPNYNLLISFLLEAMDDMGIKWQDKYDWDYLSKKELQNISVINLKAEKDPCAWMPNLPKNIPPPILPDIYRLKAAAEVNETVDEGCFTCNIF